MNEGVGEQFYRFDITTDPDDPHVKNTLDELLGIVDNNNYNIRSVIESPEIRMIETNLNRGLVNYDIIVNSKDTDLIDRIDQLAGDVSYVPVTVTMDITKFISNKNTNVGSIITATEGIIKVLTQKVLGFNIINVETIRLDNNIVVFTPITEEQISVYENPLYLAEYYRIVNMDILGGYQVLSNDPMARYVLSDLYRERDYVITDVNPIYVQGVSLIPVGNDDNEENHYNEILTIVDSMITKYCQDGYFSYELGLHEMADVLLLKELGTLWDTEVVYSEEEVVVLKRNEGVDFGTDPELWFRSNVEMIRKGQFPTITLFGDWQFNVGGSFNEVHGKEWNQVIIQYAALLAYRKLGLDDPFIQPFTHTIKVNNDLSITLSVPTHSHVKTFLEHFNNISRKDIFAEPCENLENGVIKRWYVQSVDKRSIPMVLTNTYEDGSSDEVLVFRSPAVNLYSPSPFDFDNVDMGKVKKDLLDHMREYYKLCHDNVEPVLLDHINKMSLMELLDLVEVKERPNQPTYCYSKNTLLNLTQPINPITRRPFTDNVLIKAMLMEWGTRGLFKVGPLLGLYEKVPVKILIPTNFGQPLINKEVLDPLEYQITGDVYQVSVGFDNGTINDMFEIATNDKDELKRLVEDLWSSGFFLNYWTSAVQKYSDLNSYVVIVNSPILMNANKSKSDGTFAIEYMKEVVNNL